MRDLGFPAAGAAQQRYVMSNACARKRCICKLLGLFRGKHVSVSQPREGKVYARHWPRRIIGCRSMFWIILQSSQAIFEHRLVEAEGSL